MLGRTNNLYKNTVPWNIKDLIVFSSLLTIYMVVGGSLVKYCSTFLCNIGYHGFILLDICVLIMCFGVLKLILKKYMNGWSQLLSGKEVFFTNIPSSIGIALAMGLVLSLVDYYVSPFLFPGLFFKPLPYTFSLFIIYPIIIAPVTEEIWFRSFFYRGIKKRFGLEIGLIISTIMFSLYHYYNFSSITIILFSIFITIYYERTKALYNCILIHSICNSINLTVRFFL